VTTVLNAYFSLSIYNSAGELLRTLATLQPMQNSDSAFDVLTPAFAPAEGQEAVISAAGQVIHWDGRNDSGTLLKSGSYWVRYETLDAYGSVASASKAVSIIGTAGFYQVRVFNSAGEQVKNLSGLQPIGSAAPSRLEPSKSTLDSSDGGEVSFDLGIGSFSWDGTGDQGQNLASGTYTVQLSVQDASGSHWVMSVKLALLNTPSSPLGQVVAGPNPWKTAQNTLLRIQAEGLLVEFEGRLYSLAGELVLTASARHSASLTMDSSGKALASGVYLLALHGRDLKGNKERKVIKIYVFN
jgi:flagellar hook assembly protein FlgD